MTKHWSSKTLVALTSCESELDVMNKGATESNGHQERGRGHGHIIQHSAQDRRRRGAGSFEQTWHREDAPHQHTGAVDAKCNSESGKGVQKIDGENNVADIVTKNVKVGVSTAARSRSVQSAVAGSALHQTQQRQKERQRWHAVVEPDPSPEEYEAFGAESTAMRAQNATEVEDVKGTRSLARQPLALLARGCNLLQADAVSEPFYLQAREKPRTVRRSLAQTEHEVRPQVRGPLREGTSGCRNGRGRVRQQEQVRCAACAVCTGEDSNRCQASADFEREGRLWNLSGSAFSKIEATPFCSGQSSRASIWPREVLERQSLARSQTLLRAPFDLHTPPSQRNAWAQAVPQNRVMLHLRFARWWSGG